MLSRRQFLATSLAAGSLGLSPALAQQSRTIKKFNLPQRFMPRKIRIWRRLPPGEIHVYPDLFALYWTLPNRRVIRYTIGVGRGELYHAGTFFVGAKQEWPNWTPTADMVKRRPKEFARYANRGMPGGIDNPLGARALYLHTEESGDSYLRIHGTNNPRSIGAAVSQGCARLVNEHIIELYNRVPMNTRVVLYPKKGNSKEHA